VQQRLVGLVRLAKMLCVLFSLIQIFIPDTAALAVAVQTWAAVLSCAVFAFVVYRVRVPKAARAACKIGS
jgi:hypothetical protein